MASPLCVATSKNWVTGTNGEWFYPADYAYILLREPAVSDFLRVDPSKAAEIATTVGFPLQIENGGVLYRASGSFKTENWPGPVPSGQAFGSVSHGETRFGLGISGGAWLPDVTNTNNVSSNYVLGLNTAADPGVAYGPVMGRCALQLLEFIQKTCPRP